jgi:hypothetical protein
MAAHPLAHPPQHHYGCLPLAGTGRASETHVHRQTVPVLYQDVAIEAQAHLLAGPSPAVSASSSVGEKWVPLARRWLRISLNPTTRNGLKAISCFGRIRSS